MSLFAKNVAPSPVGGYGDRHVTIGSKDAYANSGRPVRTLVANPDAIGQTIPGRSAPGMSTSTLASGMNQRPREFTTRPWWIRRRRNANRLISSVPSVGRGYDAWINCVRIVTIDS